MANEHRAPSLDLSWLERLARDPSAFDFYVALRRFDGIEPFLSTHRHRGEAGGRTIPSGTEAIHGL